MNHSTCADSGAKAPAEKSRSGGDYTRTTPAKPKKPRFPLWLHTGTGQWCRKVKGKHHYFGTDRDKALAEYTRVREDLEAGRIPPPPGVDRVRLLYLTHAFMTFQKHKVATGEIATRTYEDYYTSCELLLKHLGKTTVVEEIRPDDLLKYRQALAETRNASSVGNEVNRARVILRFAFENGLTDRPVRFGAFKRPSKSVVRRQRAERGPRMFTPVQLRKILKTADVQLKAMILLSLNAGFGNHDIATLPLSAVDLDAGWIDYPRPKTGIDRRCPLWRETVAAVKAALATRTKPKDPQYADLVFITKYGAPWYRDGKPSGAITHEFRKVLDKLKLYREGLSFYALRHVHQTIGDETGDYLAVRRLMGHADNSISDTYRERFPDERLQKVTSHIRTWLYGKRGVR